MVEETDNHSLNKYSTDETNWEHSTDMQHIEERLVIRDTDANRSNYTPHSSATFVATDTGVVYDGDGGSWNKSTREYGESIADSVRAQGSPFYDVKAFGAEGDANTDDTTAIQDTVNAAGADGGGIVFLPSGTYVTSGIIEVNDSDVRIVGPDATISPPGTYEGWVFDVNDIANFSISGLTFDMGVSGQGFRPITAHVTDHLLIEDITVVGTYDGGSTTSEGILHVNMTTEDGSGIVRNFRAMDGSVQDTTAGGTWGVLTPGHVGTLRFEDCHFHNWADNGIYSSGDGKAIVEGGTYKNNGNANVRFHGDGSVVRDSTLVLDTDFQHGNSRCVWLRGGRDHVIDNCEILVDSGAGNQTPISIHGDVAGLEVRSTDIEINGATDWILNDINSGVDNKGVTFRDCKFHGDRPTTNDDYFITANREGTKFIDCWADARNTAADGRFVQAQFPDIEFRGCEITANIYGVHVSGDGVVIENTNVTATDFGSSINLDAVANLRMSNVEGDASGWGDTTDMIVENFTGQMGYGGTRQTIDGWGLNAGDPTSTGQWNGSGEEGLFVRDTTNSNNYAYINGGWVTL